MAALCGELDHGMEGPPRTLWSNAHVRQQLIVDLLSKQSSLSISRVMSDVFTQYVQTSDSPLLSAFWRLAILFIILSIMVSYIFSCHVARYSNENRGRAWRAVRLSSCVSQRATDAKFDTEFRELARMCRNLHASGITPRVAFMVRILENLQLCFS